MKSYAWEDPIPAWRKQRGGPCQTEECARARGRRPPPAAPQDAQRPAPAAAPLRGVLPGSAPAQGPRLGSAGFGGAAGAVLGQRENCLASYFFSEGVSLVARNQVGLMPRRKK